MSAGLWLSLPNYCGPENHFTHCREDELLNNWSGKEIDRARSKNLACCCENVCQFEIPFHPVLYSKLRVYGDEILKS